MIAGRTSGSPGYPAVSRIAVLGGGGMAEQESAVLGGGGMAEQDDSAVLGGGGMTEQDESAVLGGGGMIDPERPGLLAMASGYRPAGRDVRPSSSPRSSSEDSRPRPVVSAGNPADRAALAPNSI
jgi:hypothetical protein